MTKVTVSDMKFDVVIGNPPYQPDTKEDDRKNGGSRNKIWQKFVVLAFDVCADNGYIAMVTPANWRQSNFTAGVHKKSQELIWSNQIVHYENTTAFSDITLLIDWWVVRKSPAANDHVPDYLRQFCVLPHDLDNAPLTHSFFKALAEEDDCFVQELKGYDRRGYACDIKKTAEENPKYAYPHLNTTAQLKKKQFDWYDEKAPGFDDKKVMITDSGKIIPVYDDGKLGCGTHARGYFVSDDAEAELLVRFFEESFPILEAEVGSTAFQGRALHFVRRIPKQWLKDQLSND